MKSILFKTEAVKAILDGRKTVMRRVLAEKERLDKKHGLDREPYKFRTGEWCVDKQTDVDDYRTCVLKPRYQPGDVLYVRETWCSAYEGERYFYRADKHTRREEKQLLDYDDVRWRPSIHMPREAARIFLRVMDIRAERLQEMPHDAPKKEGIHYCECPDGFTWNSHTTMQDCYINPIGAMKALWNSTVKKSDLETYGWDANPWVWVIEFERISREEAEKEEYHVD